MFECNRKTSCPGFPGDRDEQPDYCQWQQQNQQERKGQTRQEEPGENHGTQYKNADPGKHKQQEDRRTEQSDHANDQTCSTDRALERPDEFLAIDDDSC